MPFTVYAVLYQRGGKMGRPKIQFQFELVYKEAILQTLHPQKHVFIGTNFHFVGRNCTAGCIHLVFCMHKNLLLQAQPLYILLNISQTVTLILTLYSSYLFCVL